MLDFEKQKKFIVRRVLEYGLIGDWKIINKQYGITEISAIAITLKDLDEKSLAFIFSFIKYS